MKKYMIAVSSHGNHYVIATTKDKNSSLNIFVPIPIDTVFDKLLKGDLSPAERDYTFVYDDRDEGLNMRRIVSIAIGSSLSSGNDEGIVTVGDSESYSFPVNSLIDIGVTTDSIGDPTVFSMHLIDVE